MQARKNSIVVSNDIKELTGKGEEWLTSGSGDVLAVFREGMIVDDTPHPGNGREVTKAPSYEFICHMCSKPFFSPVPTVLEPLCDKCLEYILDCESYSEERDFE